MSHDGGGTADDDDSEVTFNPRSLIEADAMLALMSMSQLPNSSRVEHDDRRDGHDVDGRDPPRSDVSMTRSDDNRRDVPSLSSRRANNDDLDGSGPTTSGEQVLHPVPRAGRSPLLSPMAVSMSVPGHIRVTYGSDAMFGRVTPSPFNSEPVVTRNNQMPVVPGNHTRGDERDHYSTHEVPVHHGASSYRDEMFPRHGHDVKPMRPDTSGIQRNDGTGGYSVHRTDVPSYASEGPQWPTNSRYNASRDAVPAMRTDIHNSAIDEVYAQDALVWDANTRCFATTSYGNTVSSPLMGSNNLRMNQPSHSGYQPSMTAGHARPSVSSGPRNDDGPNTMAGGVHTVQSNVPGGRAGSMSALTRDQTYRPSGYNDGRNVQTMRTDQSDRLINEDVRDSQGYESGIQSYARETQWAPISGSVMTRHLVSKPIPDLRGPMNYPANSQGTPFRSTNMEAKQPVSSTQMGSNALRSDQHYGVGFQPYVPSYGYRPLRSTGPWDQADDQLSTRAPTFPASRLGVDERGSPQPVADHIRKSDSNCRYQSLPPPPPLRFMGTDTNSRANHTVQRFSGTTGGNDEPALMYRASEGSRQVPTTLPGGTVHISDFRAPVPRPSDQVAVAPRPVESIDMEAELHDSRANHTVQRFSGTAGGNDEPALMYRASEGSRQVPTTLPGGTVHSSDFRAAVPRPSDQVAVAPRPVESIDMEAELHDLRRKLASFEMLAVEMSGSGVLPPAPGTTLKYSPEEAKLAKKLKSLDKHSDHTKSRLKSHKQLKYVSNKGGSDRSASSSSEEESPDRDSDGSCESRRGSDIVRMVHSRHSPKLPPFTGLGESWNVWLNRFNDVARSRGWTAAEKLDELLPRLQGQAGEFVYGQLSPRTRESFKGLSKELECRFRKIETAGTFRTKFSQRRQKVGESIESYAAELKCLYDKGYPDRDRRTRKEDLLRRFMEGLVDDDARHSVEFVRAPDDIDGAVFEVVNFMDSRRCSSTN